MARRASIGLKAAGRGSRPAPSGWPGPPPYRRRARRDRTLALHGEPMHPRDLLPAGQHRSARSAVPTRRSRTARRDRRTGHRGVPPRWRGGPRSALAPGGLLQPALPLRDLLESSHPRALATHAAMAGSMDRAPESSKEPFCLIGGRSSKPPGCILVARVKDSLLERLPRHFGRASLGLSRKLRRSAVTSEPNVGAEFNGQSQCPTPERYSGLSAGRGAAAAVRDLDHPPGLRGARLRAAGDAGARAARRAERQIRRGGRPADVQGALARAAARAGHRARGGPPAASRVP